MKTLETKQIFAYILYSKLKGTAPKDFPDTNEMLETVDNILPALEKTIVEFMGFRKQADEINTSVAAGKMQPTDGQEKINVLQKEVRAYEMDNGKQPVKVDLESAAFGILVQQFERWGKTWFDQVEDFVAVSKDLKKVE